MEFSAIRTRCAVRFRDPDNNIITDTTWKDYVNEAYERILGATPFWPWNKSRVTLSFAAGDTSKTLGTGNWKVTVVFNDTNDLLMREEQGETSYRIRYPDSTVRGVPTEYQVFDGSLEVFPTPEVTTSIIVDLEGVPARMFGDTDTPIFPAQYHQAIIEFAIAMAYQDDGEFDQANAHEARAQAIVKEMMNDLLQPAGGGYPQPVDTWWQ